MYRCPELVLWCCIHIVELCELAKKVGELSFAVVVARSMGWL